MFCSFAACEGKVLATRIAVWKNPNFVLCENFPKDLFWWKIHSRRFNCKEVTESERAESEGKEKAKPVDCRYASLSQRGEVHSLKVPQLERVFVEHQKLHAAECDA